MTAYNFKRRFVSPIQVGLGIARDDAELGPLPAPKRQTIRADRKRHARPGEELQLYCGMRTRQCFLIGRARCTSILSLYLAAGIRFALVGGARCKDLDNFANQDGFKNIEDMRQFWREEHPGAVSFAGVIIFWQPIEEKTDAVRAT